MGGAADGSGCTTPLCTVSPKASVISSRQYYSRGGSGVLEAILVLGKACDKAATSCMQSRNKDTVICRHAATIVTTRGVSNYAAF